MLLAFLDYYRAALLDRAHGLTRDQLSAAHPPTTLTLDRLIGHMALVERSWFQWRFDGEDEPEPYASLDWDADVDAEMTLAGTWSAEELLGEFDSAVADSNRRIADATSLDQVSERPNRDGEYFRIDAISTAAAIATLRTVGLVGGTFTSAELLCGGRTQAIRKVRTAVSI